MVFSASSANQLTTTAIATVTANNLSQEITLCEAKIRTAGSQQLFQTLYNATTIGNPPGDPNNSNTVLTPIQTAFRDAFLEGGYTVGYDGTSGYWSFSWQNIEG